MLRWVLEKKGCKLHVRIDEMDGGGGSIEWLVEVTRTAGRLEMEMEDAAVCSVSTSRAAAKVKAEEPVEKERSRSWGIASRSYREAFFGVVGHSPKVRVSCAWGCPWCV